MKAVLTTGNGGYDKLVYKDVPKPVPKSDEVLVKVLAAGCNNTEINTRLGWYSKSVQKATNDEQAEVQSDVEREDGGWNKKTPFPFIQGTDCCGRIVSAGDGVADAPDVMGKRVLIRSCQRGPEGFASTDSVWMGSDHNGAFAEYVVARRTEVFVVECEWSDVELGSIPCAYGTAENMLHIANVQKGDRVLVPGASGGVGSAVVQLAKRRGAHVTALCGSSKAEAVKALGASEVHGARHGDQAWTDLMASLKDSVDVVVDNVGGEGFPDIIECLRRGGRYITSGAISGPVVSLDLRTLYLKDLKLLGSTLWEEPVFPNLISYIEKGEIKPLIAKTFPLQNIVDAQVEFLKKTHVGKFVLVPEHNE